jgi:hypothetical protein
MPLDGYSFDPVVQTLSLADELILEDGWTQKEYGAEPGVPHCVVGAIQVAAKRVASAFWIYYELRWLAGECYGKAIGTDCVERWQDQDGRTLAEVRDGFRRAIDHAIAQKAAAR